MSKKPKTKKLRKPKRTAEERAKLYASFAARVEKKIRALGYRDYGAYQVKHSTLSLVQMAKELRVPESLFLVYHAAWADAHAPKLAIPSPKEK